MKKVILITSLLILSLTSCTNEKNNEEQPTSKKKPEQLLSNQKDVSTPEEKSDITPEPINELDQKLKQRENIIKNLKKNNVVTINGDKFLLTSGSITPGAIVFNLLMKESGTVKGSIVVVTQAELKIKGTAIHRIADNTYRLTPSSNELASTYKKLTKNAQYKHVELEIDYSPITSPPMW
jgi:hypothetical protein